MKKETFMGLALITGWVLTSIGMSSGMIDAIKHFRNKK